MKLLRLVPLACLLGLAFAAAPNYRAMIDARYVEITAAFKKNDIHAMDAFFAPDFTLKSTQGPEIDRAHMITDLKRQMANMHDVTWDRHVTKLTQKGNDFDVLVTGHFVGKFKMQDGKMHVFDLHSTADDLWTMKGHALLLKHSTATKLDAKVDGKKPGG